jgi:hypothetical protein
VSRWLAFAVPVVWLEAVWYAFGPAAAFTSGVTGIAVAIVAMWEAGGRPR